MRPSAGLILYRWRNEELQVLLGHMGGPFWAKRDEGAWSIPKGMIEKGEEPMEAAFREFEEEIGVRPEGGPIEIGTARQKGGKQVSVWAVEGDFDPERHKSNTFSLEWPPKSGKIQEYPELDRVEWMSLDQACNKAIGGQAEIFRELERKLE